MNTFISYIILIYTLGWGVFPLFSKSPKLESGEVANGLKNDPLEILAQLVKVLRWHNDTLFYSEGILWE